MPVQSKTDRNQLQFFALDQLVEQESIVRIIDLFCKCIDYQNLGFIIKGKSHEGSPAFETFTPHRNLYLWIPPQNPFVPITRKSM